MPENFSPEYKQVNHNSPYSVNYFLSLASVPKQEQKIFVLSGRNIGIALPD